MVLSVHRQWNYRLPRVPDHDGEENERHGQRRGNPRSFQSLRQGEKTSQLTAAATNMKLDDPVNRVVDVLQMLLTCAVLIEELYRCVGQAAVAIIYRVFASGHWCDSAPDSGLTLITVNTV